MTAIAQPIDQSPADYDPADWLGLTDSYHVNMDETDVYVAPCRFVRLEVEGTLLHLSVEEARRIGGSLVRAADDIDAGRGTI